MTCNSNWSVHLEWWTDLFWKETAIHFSGETTEDMPVEGNSRNKCTIKHRPHSHTIGATAHHLWWSCFIFAQSRHEGRNRNRHYDAEHDTVCFPQYVKNRRLHSCSHTTWSVIREEDSHRFIRSIKAFSRGVLFGSIVTPSLHYRLMVYFISSTAVSSQGS